MKLGLGNSTGKGTLSQPGIVNDSLEAYLKYNGGLPQELSEGSLSLDGSNDYFGGTATVAGATKLTITCWLKHYDTDTINILSKGNYNDNAAGFHLKLDGNRISFSVRQQFEYWDNQVETFNEWNHIAIVWDSDAGTTKLYVNGTYQHVGSTGGTYAAVQSEAAALLIGRNTASGSTYGKANIANVGIWVDKASTEAEIKSIMHKNYSTLSSTESTSLHRWWGLDSSYTVVDPSPAVKTADSVSGSVATLYNGASIDSFDSPKKWRGIDSSGNNHHSELYTGRALEFDGVTDYLTGPADTVLPTDLSKDFTVAVWFKVDTAADAIIWGIKQNNENRVGLCIADDGEIAQAHYDDRDGQSDYIRSATAVGTIKPNKWYRAVCVWTGIGATTAGDTGAGVRSLISHQKFYINGVTPTVTDQSVYGSELGPTQEYLTIGAVGETVEHWFSGKMSDFQIWDYAWTAEDAAFDYANPEKTVLNRGGTSLTESNLKLWYPMNNGYRGLQSCVFDASNTGLNDVSVTNGDFSDTTSIDSSSSALTGWTNGSTHNSTNKFTIADGKCTVISDGTATAITQEILTIGVAYKYSIEITEATSGAIKLSHGSVYFASSLNSVGTYTGYFTASDATFGITRNGACNITFDNVSLETVNNKHHATTVFYGDELIANGGFETNVSGWTDINGSLASGPTHNTSHAKVGAESLSFVANAYEEGVLASFTTVTGRTYKVDFWAKPLNSETKIRLVLREGDGSGFISTEDLTLSSYSTATGTVGSGNWYNITKTFTESGGGSSCEIRIASASDDADGTFAIDEVSIKEEGIASGWTDADQQTDIPQTALQSYNQLAFARGDDSLSNSFGMKKTDTGSNTFMGLTEGSLSAWVFINKKESCTLWQMNIQGSSSTDYLRSYYADSTGRIDIVQEKGNVAQFSYSVDLDSIWPDHTFLKQWIHFVWSNDNTTAVPKIYINGEDQALLEAVNTDKSGWSDFTNDGNTNDFSVMGGGWGNVLSGGMTEISCWNKQLTQAEVNELYNDGKAADALTHSASGNLKGYWRNDGVGRYWTSLSSPGTNTLALQNAGEAELITQQAGEDTSRDCQGFLLNKRRETASLNLYDDQSEFIAQGPLVKSGHPLTIAEFENFTVSMWVKIEGKDRVNQPLINIIQSNANHFTASYHSDEDIRFSYETNSTLVRYQTNTANLFTVGQWTHVAFVCKISESTDTDRVKIYIDGKFRTSTVAQSGTTSSPANDHSMWIGCEKTKGTKLSGLIDDVAIYSKTLTDGLTSPSDGDVAKGEISRNYKAGKRSHK